MTCFRMNNNQTLRSYCIEHGYNYGRIVNRIDEKGMTPEEAVRDYIPNRGRKDMNVKYFYQGIKLTDYCKDKGLSYSTVVCRMRGGMDTENAINSSEHRKTKYFYQGKRLINFCRDNMLDYYSIYRAMGRGMTLEKAVEKELRRKQ